MKFMKLGSKPDSFQANDNNIRFVTTDLATDIIVHVGDVEFHLHKFPLLSKSSHLQKLLETSNDENTDEIDISDIPGGPAAFEICAKFCYGMVVTLNAYNVIAARCAAEYLEMHESIEKGNLIYKIEVFLTTSIFHGWKDSIIVLQTTKSLLPWSEDLKLVSHCIDSIASKAAINPSKVEWSYTYNRKKLSSENGHDLHWNGVKKLPSVPKDWWVEDLCELDMDFYKRIITSIKSKGKVASDVIGEALKAYSYRMISSTLSKGSKKFDGDAMKQRSVLQTIIWLLPEEKSCVSCSFLLKLLRAAIILDCGETSKNELIKRVGSRLEDASVADLLIPTTNSEGTDYDIDIVSNILEEFIIQYQSSDQLDDKEAQKHQGIRTKLAVAKLVDGYLVEIAKDPKLPLAKFIDLTAMVSGDSRPVHDSLYRAIDMYLKEHKTLSKSEKKKLCSLMDCKKLSSEACMHAVQNERLPLRLVVQILFFEQMRAAAATTSSRAESGGSYGSSRSVITTNTEDDSDGVVTIEDHNSSVQQSMKVTGTMTRNDSGNAWVDNKTKVVSPGKKKMLGKVLLQGRGLPAAGDNLSSSDTTSESPGSGNQEDQAKPTPSRSTRLPA